MRKEDSSKGVLSHLMTHKCKPTLKAIVVDMKVLTTAQKKKIGEIRN